MRVTVLADAAAVRGSATAADVMIDGTLAAVESVLRGDGHAVTRVLTAPGGGWIDELRAFGPELVFNLCEGVDGAAGGEAPVIGALELLGVPYTGSSAWTAALCLRKDATNALLAAAGLPVPPWAVVRPGAAVPERALAAVGLPAIVKPAAEDASLGIGQDAVVRDAAELAARLAAAGRRWDALLVQRYVAGRELNVGVLGGRALPAAEIDFAAMPAGMWHIVSYRSKWEEGSDEDRGAQPVCPAPLGPALAAEVEAVALDAWRAVGGGGYGRVDLRVDERGRPWVLEVNPNPDLAPGAGLARMARAAGVGYEALVRRICALARGAPGAPGAAGADGQASASLGGPAGVARPRVNIAAAAGAS